MPHNHRHKRKSNKDNDYGQSWEIAAALIVGPLTIEEIRDHFKSYLRMLGMFNFAETMPRRTDRRHEGHDLESQLNKLITKGWIIKNDQSYALTESGQREAEKIIGDMANTRKYLRSVQEPQFVSKVSLGAHLGLALIKLPAGFISGSVGLINDAVDTLVDGLSSIMVYFGIRYDKEKQVNTILVIIMLITGGFTLYEAIRRFIVPSQPDIDLFTFFAALVSALVCAVLGLYQRYIGVKSGSLALITQSIDSRNHVIVAASVIAGLIASLLKFNLLDTLVGFVVAVLILKSAVELAIEVIRSLGDDEMDVSHYKIGILTSYETFRNNQFRDWMLYLIETKGPLSRQDLLKEAYQAVDFSRNPTLRALGLGQSPADNKSAEDCLTALIQQGWVEAASDIYVTSSGKEYLKSQLKGTHSTNRRKYKFHN